MQKDQERIKQNQDNINLFYQNFISSGLKSELGSGKLEWEPLYFIIIYFRNSAEEVCKAIRELLLILMCLVMVNFSPSYVPDLPFPKLPVSKYTIGFNFSSTIKNQTADISYLLSAFYSLSAEFQ